MLSRIKYYFHSAINHKNRSIATQKKTKSFNWKSTILLFFFVIVKNVLYNHRVKLRKREKKRHH